MAYETLKTFMPAVYVHHQYIYHTLSGLGESLCTIPHAVRTTTIYCAKQYDSIQCVPPSCTTSDIHWIYERNIG